MTRSRSRVSDRAKRNHAAVRALRVAGGLGLAAFFVVAAPGAVTPVHAEGAGPTFDAIANAYGVDITYQNSSLPLGLTPEIAGPTAQAHRDSLGDSDAFASFPYPGDVTAGLPGVAGALLGGLPVPEYPVIVTTQAGDAPKDQAVPGIGLHAYSGTADASARAHFGVVDGVGYTSVARVETLSDQSVKASAETTFGVNLLNVISLSGVDSSAEVSADGSSGDLERRAHLSIGQISVPGLSLHLPNTTPGSVPVPIPLPGVPQVQPIKLPVLPILFGGQTLSTPDLGFEDGTFTVALPLLDHSVKFAIPAQSVVSALKALGISVRYQSAESSSTGITAATLTFSHTLPKLPPNKYYNGPTTVSLTVGRATANVTMKPVGSSFGAGASSTGDTGNSSSGVSTTSGGSGAPATGLSPALGGGSGSGVDVGTSGSSSPVGAGTTPLPGAGSVPGSNQPRLVAASLSEANRGDISALYLMCIGVGVVGLTAAWVLRLVGVRLLWMS